MVTSDYYSDFFELDHLRSTSSVYVIKKLKANFVRHGIPEQLLSDNGSQFVSRDFMKFSKEWNFEHRTNSPHHHKAKGKPEGAVKKAMKILAKCKRSGSDIFLALLHHGNTPPTGTQISPVQRRLNRRTRSLLPMTAGLLKPSVADEYLTRTKLRLRQQEQARYYNRNVRDLTPLEAGDSVRVKPWQVGKKEWDKGVIRKRLDDWSYEVELPNGVLRRNRVHFRKTSKPAISREQRPQVPTLEASEQSRENFPAHLHEKSREQSHQQSRQQSHKRSHEQPRKQPPGQSREQSCEQSHEPPSQVEVPLRRSNRIRKMPAHLRDYVLI